MQFNFIKLNESIKERLENLQIGDVIICNNVKVENTEGEEFYLTNNRAYVVVTNDSIIDMNTFKTARQVFEIATRNKTAQDKGRYKQDGTLNKQIYRYNYNISPNQNNGLKDESIVVCNYMILITDSQYFRKTRYKYTEEEVKEFLQYYYDYLNHLNENIKLNESTNGFNPNYIFKYKDVEIEIQVDGTIYLQGLIIFDNITMDFDFDYLDDNLMITEDGETYTIIDNLEQSNRQISYNTESRLTNNEIDAIVNAFDVMLIDYDNYIANSDYELNVEE